MTTLDVLVVFVVLAQRTANHIAGDYVIRYNGTP
jgi:hypothetical protein